MGATDVWKLVPTALLLLVLGIINRALTRSWFISVAGGGFAILEAVVLEWKDVRTNTAPFENGRGAEDEAGRENIVD